MNNQDGLQTAIGRSWMAPMIVIEETTFTEFNDDGTPVSEINSRTEPSSTPVVTDEMQIQMLSALIFEFDSAENAEKGIELFHAAQKEQISRDPRNPATNEFTPDLGDTAYGNEGSYEVENMDGEIHELSVAYVLVQDDNLIYQVFGQFVSGDHVQLATDIVSMMIDAEAGDSEPVYDMMGGSTGGMWEKLNGVEVAMPEGTTVADLEVYPVSDDAVMGDSVVVPVIDPENLADIPGLTGSWHVTYAPAGGGVLQATPDVYPPGVFNIELWVMEFQDPTHATASALSLNDSLTMPLGIVTTEGSSFWSEDREGISMVNTGFVQDRSIPEGDAAVVVVAEGSTVYAARVYSNGPAPTPLANELIDTMIATEPGENPESIEDTTATGGMWELFPQSGDDVLYGLEPVYVRYVDPMLKPTGTPVG